MFICCHIFIENKADIIVTTEILLQYNTYHYLPRM